MELIYAEYWNMKYYKTSQFLDVVQLPPTDASSIWKPEVDPVNIKFS